MAVSLPTTLPHDLNDDIIQQAHEVWWKALLLIGSNLLALPAIVFNFYMRIYVLGISLTGSMIVSIIYHTCSAGTFCFSHPLNMWRLLDHIAANSLLAMLFLFVINYARQRARKLIKITKSLAAASSSSYNNVRQSSRQTRTGIYDNDLIEDIEREILKYYEQLPVMIYDAWSAIITWVYIFIVIASVLAHPFSIQSFIIIITFGLIFIFFKFTLVDEGNISYLLPRIKKGYLITGIILSFGSLIFFFLDTDKQHHYIFHSLWHALLFLGVLFYSIGLTYDHPKWKKISYITETIKKRLNYSADATIATDASIEKGKTKNIVKQRNIKTRKNNFYREHPYIKERKQQQQQQKRRRRTTTIRI
jgi:hypothetical protein